MQRFAPERAHDAGRQGALRALDWLVIALFLAALVAPELAQRFFSADSSAEREERRAADAPVLDGSWAALLDFPAAYDAWYGDHFGLRPELIELHNRVLWQVFDLSPTPEMVRGRGDWLFTTVAHSLDVWRGRYPFTKGELQAWTELLEGRAAWCREQGAEYVFAIAPNKSTIYPEQMPARLGPLGTTRLDQLVAYLAEHSSFRVLDLRPALLTAKRDFPGPAGYEPLYYPLGTHWNKRGGAVAAHEILLHIARRWPSVVPWEPRTLTFTSTAKQGDSWARRMYLDDLLTQENVDWQFPEPARAHAVPLDWGVPERDVAFEQDTPELPTAVIMHDSFGAPLLPLFAEHFRRMTAYWTTDFLTESVQREAPDVVLQILVERGLAAVRPIDTPADSPEVLRREFDAAPRRLCRIESLADLEARGSAKLSAATDGDALAEVSLERVGDGVLTPALELGDDEWALVRMLVSSPKATELWLLFQTETEPEFSRKVRFARRALQPGANEVFVKLRVPDLAGRLSIEAGGRGTLILHDLQVVAVPR